MTLQTSKGALARRAPLGIASIFQPDSYFEIIECHGKIKIFPFRLEVFEPTASFFIELSDLDSPGTPRTLSGAQFGASAVRIHSPTPIRCQLAAIVRCALDNHEARLTIRDSFRDSLALLEGNEPKLVEVARFSARSDANSSHGRRA
jgi:hypothetical protein